MSSPTRRRGRGPRRAAARRRGGGPPGAAGGHVRRASLRHRQGARRDHAARRPGPQRQPGPAGAGAAREAVHRPRHRRTTPRATACSPSATPTTARSWSPRCPTRGRSAARPAAGRRGARDRHRACCCSAPPAGWSCAWGCCHWNRMGHTAGRIAGGDLSHRVEPTDPRSEVGRLGIALNGMLDRLEEAFSRARRARTGCATSSPTPSHELRTPLASIAVRRAVPDGRGRRSRGDRARDAPHRGRGRTDGRARRGPADARAARPGRGRAARRARPGVARRRRSRRRAGHGPSARDLARGRALRGDGRRSPAATGARQPAAQRAGAHAGRHGDRRLGQAPGATPCGSRCATTGRGFRPTTPMRCSSASGAPRAAVCAAPPAPGSGWRSSPASWTPTTAAWGRRTPRAAAPRSSCSCPPRRRAARSQAPPRKLRPGL